MTMRKWLVVFLATLGIAELRAAIDDALLMFSTPGPDTYADGSTVLPGECYALCYVTDAATFAIRADGTAAQGGEVLVTAPVAQDGRCPNLIYVLPAAKAASLAGGSYAVYLLDTRVRNAQTGAYEVAGLSGGKAAVVNGAGAVATGASLSSSSSGGLSVYNGQVVSGGTVSELSVIDRPVITAFRVEGAEVVLTVSGLSPAADYRVLTGAGPGGINKEVSATFKDNAFTVDRSAGSFFKVVGTRKVNP